MNGQFCSRKHLCSKTFLHEGSLLHDGTLLYGGSICSKCHFFARELKNNYEREKKKNYGLRVTLLVKKY